MRPVAEDNLKDMPHPGQIHFRRLEHGDLPLLHHWLNSGETLRWYGRKPTSYQQIVNKYSPRIEGRTPTSCYLCIYQERPIAYLQTYRIYDYPDYNSYIGADEFTAGVDLFVGEQKYIGIGLGPRILRTFLEKIVFADRCVQTCIVGPDSGNLRAIRAYEKVGFRHWKTIQVANEPQPEYLMCISREQIENDI